MSSAHLFCLAAVLVVLAFLARVAAARAALRHAARQDARPISQRRETPTWADVAAILLRRVAIPACWLGALAAFVFACLRYGRM